MTDFSPAALTKAGILPTRRLTRREEYVEKFPSGWATEDDVKRTLALVAEATVAGVLKGSEASAVAKACAEWIRARSLELDREHVAELEREVTRLTKELARAKGTP